MRNLLPWIWLAVVIALATVLLRLHGEWALALLGLVIAIPLYSAWLRQS